MKTKNKELDVDFIGSQEPLSREEEKNISDYLTVNKKDRKRKTPISSKRTVAKKTTV